MGEISVGRALGAGFGLIRRHPGAILVWAVAYLVVGVLPRLGLMAMILPAWLKAMPAAAGGAPGLTADVLHAQATMLQLQPLSLLLSMLAQTLLLGAAYRAVLFPEE